MQASLLDYQDLIQKLNPDSSGNYEIPALIAILDIRNPDGYITATKAAYLGDVQRILNDLGYNAGKFNASDISDKYYVLTTWDLRVIRDTALARP